MGVSAYPPFLIPIVEAIVNDFQRYVAEEFVEEYRTQADHGFFNDTGARHHAEASADAWAETLAWFR